MKVLFGKVFTGFEFFGVPYATEQSQSVWFSAVGRSSRGMVGAASRFLFMTIPFKVFS